MERKFRSELEIDFDFVWKSIESNRFNSTSYEIHVDF